MPKYIDVKIVNRFGRWWVLYNGQILSVFSCKSQAETYVGGLTVGLIINGKL